MGVAGGIPESRQRDSWHATMDGMAIHTVTAETAVSKGRSDFRLFSFIGIYQSVTLIHIP